MSTTSYNVIWAVYGAFNPTANTYQVKDITAHLQAILQTNVTSVKFCNDNFTDPCIGIHKVFSACVAFNGRRYLYAGKEDETVDFTKLPINPQGTTDLQLRELSAQLVEGGWPTPYNNYLFSACAFQITNISTNPYPPTSDTSEWVSVDFYFSKSNSLDQSLSQLISIGDTPLSVKLPSEGTGNYTNNNFKLYDISRFVTANPKIITPNTPYYLYAQVRSATNSGVLSGSFSTNTFIPHIPQ